MCVGSRILYPSDNLPSHVTVQAGQPAVFECVADTNSYMSFTVAYLVRGNSSAAFGQCQNCSFSPTYLYCSEREEDNSCSELEYNNTIIGRSTNHLVARWVSPQLSHSGAEVMCALAGRGITQWVHTATLLVLPPSIALSPPSSPAGPQLVALLAGVASAVLVVVGGVCLVGVAVWYRLKCWSSSGWQRLQQSKCMTLCVSVMGGAIVSVSSCLL